MPKLLDRIYGRLDTAIYRWKIDDYFLFCIDSLFFFSRLVLTSEIKDNTIVASHFFFHWLGVASEQKQNRCELIKETTAAIRLAQRRQPSRVIDLFLFPLSIVIFASCSDPTVPD